MESTGRSPQAGDMVIILAKMKSGAVTELSGAVEEISAEYAYFALDCIDVTSGKDSDCTPIERKIWPKGATKLFRVGVRVDELKPFDGSPISEDSPCWEVRV